MPHPRHVIHAAFEAQAHATPDAVAVLCENRSLTFDELNRRANQLARSLRKRGIGSGRLVAICLERRVEMIVALLGALKSGGAYLPLEPDHPIPLLRDILEDAAPAVLLTHDPWCGRFRSSAVPCLSMDSEHDEIASEDDRDLDPVLVSVAPDHLAYVIYTSGSTGRPKGVMIEHRNVLHLWTALEGAIYQPLGPVQRVGVNASLAFDASVKQIIQLLSGRTLCIIPRAARADPRDFLRYIAAHRVEGFDCTPSQLRTLIDAGLLRADPPAPRFVLVGGEAIESAMWRQLAACSAIFFFNVYGPTECTVDATVARIADYPDGPVIGRPIDQVRLYLADDGGRPVAIGEVGEIYIGGAGVGRGYLKRPEWTAERFVPDPFGDEPSGRIYKTGDLGRWRPDGAVEYVGRNDGQVKVRGHRVELGEIEAHLLGNPGVVDCVVVAREDRPGETTLTGYAVADFSELKRLRHGRVAASSEELERAWRAVHDERYAVADVGPSFVGWDSSYTGQPIPEEEMQEWLRNTVERIRGLGPRRVLEIGCGVGLLLERLAPACEKYRGTDLSGEAIDKLRRWIGVQSNWRRIELERCSALEAAESRRDRYDTVILNSVIQYFPDVEYLHSVLEGVVAQVSPGGRIFVGDVRHLGLLGVFHSSTQLSRAAPEMRVAQLRRLVARAIENEKELLVDPRYFEELPSRIPGITGTQVLLKRGSASTEMTRYRYDVVLHVGGNSIRRPREEVDWHASGGRLALDAAVRRHPHSIRLRDVGNRRLSRDLSATRMITEADEGTTVELLRKALDRAPTEGEDPEVLCQEGEANGYQAQACWSGGAEGRFDLEWLDRNAPVCAAVEREEQGHAIGSARGTPALLESYYANEPAKCRLRQLLAQELRETLRSKLPEYMVPAAIVILDRMPLTPNGKKDRGALPPPDWNTPSARPYEPPQGALERTLAEIWKDVLDVQRVGREDNFFELGGHSILGVRLMLKVAETLHLAAPVLTVFQCPTVREMGEMLEGYLSSTVAPPNSGLTAEGTV